LGTKERYWSETKKGAFMKTKIYFKILIIFTGILVLSKYSAAQQIYFEISTPGIKIVAGEPYFVFIPQPRVIYYEPLPRGHYCYDRENDVFYDEYGNVYRCPSNVRYYYKHDNGKHKGWYKHSHGHKRRHRDND
jgi:hypothetical protein